MTHSRREFLRGAGAAALLPPLGDLATARHETLRMDGTAPRVPCAIRC